MSLDQAVGTAMVAYGLIIAALGLLFLFSTPPMDRPPRRPKRKPGRHFTK